MNVRTFLAISAVIYLVLGLFTVVLPQTMGSLYDVQFDRYASYMAQMYGALLVGLGVLNWLARGITDRPALDIILLGNLAGAAVASLVTILDQLNESGGGNALGWVTVALCLLLTAGFAYFRFTGEKATLRRAV